MKKLFVFVVCFVAACSNENNEKGTTTAKTEAVQHESLVAPCSAEDKSCSYLRDLYEKKPELKRQLIDELKKASLPQPNWITDGVQGDIVRITNGTEEKIIGFTCQPHNCMHSLILLHNEKNNSVGGLYSTQDDELTYFGQLTLEDRVRLCNQSSSCVEQRENTLVHRIASDLGFPIVKNTGFFGDDNCQPFNGIKRESVFGYRICETPTISSCSNSENGTCSIYAEFTDEFLHSITYTYATGSINGEALKKQLDEKFGDAQFDAKDLRPNGVTMMSWHAKWKFKHVGLSLDRFQGINIKGQPYDKLSLTLVDNSIPSPHKEYEGN